MKPPELEQREGLREQLRRVGELGVAATYGGDCQSDDAVVVERQAAQVIDWQQPSPCLEGGSEPVRRHHVYVGCAEHPSAVVASRIVEHLELVGT